MIKTLPVAVGLVGLLALGCAASTPSPAVPASVEPVATAEPPTPSATPAPARSATPAPARRLGDFPPVSDHGLVTIQEMSVGDPATSTLHVGADGAWSWTTAGGTKTGKLDATQFAAVRGLVGEAASAKPSKEPGLPCAAMPMSAARVLFGKDREMSWSGPCAGPPPPDVFLVLQQYVRQAAEGKPASELAKILKTRPRP